MTHFQLVLNLGQFFLKNYLLSLNGFLIRLDNLNIGNLENKCLNTMINLMVIFRLTHLPTCGWSILSHVLESLRHGRIVRASIQGSQLHHVVHQVDDGVQPGHLLLQLPGVLSQIKTRLNYKIKIIFFCFCGENISPVVPCSSCSPALLCKHQLSPADWRTDVATE